MHDLTLMSLIVGVMILAGCTEKSDGPTSETETGSTGTTAPEATTTDADPPTSTPTTGPDATTSSDDTGDTGDSTGTGTSTTTTGTTGEPLDEDCAFLIGKAFVSQQQWPCGPPQNPDDPVDLCPDRVSFDVDTFTYQSSDFGVSGTYTCEGGVIVGVDDIDEAHHGTIDAEKPELLWDDNVFDLE